MALSVSILFFFGVTVSVSFWVKVQHRRERISIRHTRLLIQAFAPADRDVPSPTGRV
jgi:uncharacterized membrane protein